jgi:hypothetical protein
MLDAIETAEHSVISINRITQVERDNDLDYSESGKSTGRAIRHPAQGTRLETPNRATAPGCNTPGAETGR